MLKKIKNIIESAIPQTTAHVFDPMQDNEHFEAIVISESFSGLSLVKQHQQVMNALKTSFETDVHALALKTFSPDKWTSEKSKYEHLIKGD
jgi:acid stress-induced BolA-like protein IbaG/YrbA